MKRVTFALFAAVVAGCGDEAPAPDAGPPTFPDRTVIPVDAVADLPPSPDVSIDRPAPCRAGGYRPCECMPGMGGREYCVNGAYEGMCRCDDSGPPTTDATMMIDDQFKPMEDLPPIDDTGDGATQDGGAQGMDAPRG